MDIKNFNNNYILFTNLIFGFFPISFILGNFILNINILLFCCMGIFFLRSNILKIELNLSLKIILSFFIIVFISTFLSFIKSLYLEGYEYANLIKSIAFFRYFLLLIIVYLLSKFSILNFKYFFIVAALCPFLISLDVIYQHIFGFNIIGLESYGHHNSSFFGDELIAGGFIQNFSFFSILFSFFLLKNKKNIWLILIGLLIYVLSTALLFAGNTMPVIMFFLGLLLLFIVNNKLRTIIAASFIIFIMSSAYISSIDVRLKYVNNTMFSYLKNTKTIFNEILLPSMGRIERLEQARSQNVIYQATAITDKQGIYTWGHTKLFATAIDTWKQNKIYGNGIKSFREDCKKVIENHRNRLCSSHPHNYFFEVLTETGIIGLFVVMLIALMFILFIVKNFSHLKGNNIEILFLLAGVVS